MVRYIRDVVVWYVANVHPQVGLHNASVEGAVCDGVSQAKGSAAIDP